MTLLLNALYNKVHEATSKMRLEGIIYENIYLPKYIDKPFYISSTRRVDLLFQRLIVACPV